MAVVVSEDGTVDIVPDLRPQIARDALGGPLDELREIADEQTLTAAVSIKLSPGSMTSRFYLSERMCEEVNQLNREINSRLSSDVIRIVYSEFAPHPEMNESFLL